MKGEQCLGRYGLARPLELVEARRELNRGRQGCENKLNGGM